MRIKLFALFVAVTIIMLSLCACGDSNAKSEFKPPAEIFNVRISGTSEPEIDGVKFTYDSKARINTVSFTVDGYDYTQEYSYDSERIIIKTIYKTEVIEEKVIRYVDIPVNSGYTTVDGYYICVTDDMPVNGNNAESGNGSGQDTKQQNSVDWKSLYRDYLNSFMSRDDLYISQYKDDLVYALIYIDNDDIPELFITGTSHIVWSGSVLCWISDGKTAEQDSMGDITYIEKSGLIHKNSGWTGRVYDSIYQLKDGNLTEIAYGDMSEPDDRYTWNDTNVSESEYNNKLNATFNTAKAKNAADNAFSYSQILDKLS